MKFGIDISHWQGDFNLKAAVSEGVEFAIIKGGGGDGGLYVDSRFAENYNKAQQIGLPIGVYWFSKATSVAEAQKEADYFYENVLKGRRFELPVYIDVEHRDQLALGKDALTAVVKAWLARVQAKGYWVGIYASLWTFASHVNDNELQGYAHWVAQWSKECTYSGKAGVLGMWQFGGETNALRSTKIAGQTVDQNYMLVDYPSLIKNAGLNGFTKTTTKPTVAKPAAPAKKSVDEIARECIAGKWGNGAVRKNKLEAAGYSYEEVQKRVEEILKGEAAKPQYKTHKVKAGETLSGIAAKYGTTYQAIAKLNGLADPNKIYADQVLKIPN